MRRDGAADRGRRLNLQPPGQPQLDRRVAHPGEIAEQLELEAPAELPAAGGRGMLGDQPGALLGVEGIGVGQSLRDRDNVPVASYPSLTYGYGLGYQAMRWADTVAAGHSGNLAGYTSMLLYDAERGYGVIVLRSAAGGEADAGRLAGRAFRKLRSTLPGKR